MHRDEPALLSIALSALTVALGGPRTMNLTSEE
jgi:hypothetical protein